MRDAHRQDADVGVSFRGRGSTGGLFAWLGSLSSTWWSAFLVTTGMTAFSYGIFFGLGRLSHENYVYIVFCDRGALPYIVTWLFFMAFVLLVRKNAVVNREWTAFDLEDEFFPKDASSTIQRESADAIAAKARMLPPSQRELLLIQRLDRGLQRLRNTGSSAEMSSVLNDLSSIDRQTAESGYTIPRFLLAVIPILGFIGTVLGISLAISGFAHAIAATESFVDLKVRLKEVTGSLSLAFETTLVALTMSGLIMAMIAFVQKKEDELLTAIDDFCISRILNRLKVGGDGAQGADPSARELSAINVALSERARDIEEAVRQTGEEICAWLKRLSAASSGKPPPAPGAPRSP